MTSFAAVASFAVGADTEDEDAELEPALSARVALCVGWMLAV